MINLSTRNLNISRDITSDGSLVRKSTLSDNSNISASPRLISWVESINIGGYEKTIFYTEIDSNFKKGDRVFIVNGKYDSDLLIKSDKYKKGSDGYKILDIDRCKITLDLDYTGDLPYLEDDYDSYIKIYYVRSQREFDYVNDQFIARDVFTNKFSIGQNNIIYVDGAYNGKIVATLLPNLGTNNGVTQSGFYVRDTNKPANWVNITTDFLSNNLTSYLSTNFTNSGRVIIVNKNLTYGGTNFREDDIYFYNTSTNAWEIDPEYIRPFITTSNFRRGKFKGAFNKGIYGSFNEKINWEGIDSSWNGGSVVNSVWVSGSINSNPISGSGKSYFAELDDSGKPVQKDNIDNNRGFGYSYFINMDFTKSIINNGNFIKCNLGLVGSTYSAIDKYYQNLSVDVPNKINKGNFTSCNFESSYVYNSVVKNCRTNNSYFENTKSINSHFTDAVFYKSNYNSENIIKIRAYDEWNAHLNDNDNSTGGVKYKIYKFYISISDYSKMKSLDKFSIKGLKINSEDYWTLQYDKILNFFDRGFILDSYADYEDIKTGVGFEKSQISFTCKLSTKAENTYKLSAYNISGTYSTGTYSLNDNQLPSIDIAVLIKPVNANDYNFFSNIDYNYTFKSLLPGGALSYIGDNIDISNAYIVDSSFSSGLFESSNWNSGDLYNYNSDTQIDGLPDDGKYTISVASPTQLTMTFPLNSALLKDQYYNVGDVVYLNAIDYNNGSSVTRLTNTWKIDSFVPSFLLSEYLVGTTSTIVSSLTGSGVFLTSPDGLTNSITGTNRYNYLHKVRINNSTIKSGIIRRAFISNSTIYSDTFDNSDYLFNDKIKLKSLIIMDSIFSKNGNSIKSGLITNSYLNKGSDIWYNGIFWRSLWEDSNFNNGTFIQSNWKNGIFNNGIFYQNKTSISINQFFKNLESSYYKSSVNTISLNVNNRYTWENGTFNNGQFFDSVWERGIFNNGKIYKSTWIDGSFNNGIFGDDKFNITDNNFYGGTFSNGVVINSNFYSGGTYSTGFSGINWQNGVFQSGVFSNNVNDSQATATWTNGTFNGGSFTNTAIWLNGTFNGGKFTSYYGATYAISNIQSEYTWQNGIFNDGEFGTADGVINSTWWNGEMYGGIFKGKVWNNGILSSGEFQGSSTYSSVGPVTITASAIYRSNSISFVDSFTNSYYGLWRDGFVTETKDKFIKNKEFTTTIERSSNNTKFSELVNRKKATIKNALWVTGTFSHRSGQMNNCVWLDGTFDEGTFNSSAFNPYVKRLGSNNQFGLTNSFNLNDDTCVWKNGTLNDSEFNISIWNDGLFALGTATGMIWQNGTTNYMNAYNVFWEDGLWRNGNWYGSPFEYDGTVTDDYVRQILYRGMSWSGTSSCHIWNIFENIGVPLFILSVTDPTVYLSSLINNSSGVNIMLL